VRHRIASIRWSRAAARVSVLALGLAACSSKPLPLSLQAGASFALAVAGDGGTGLGFGGTWLAQAGRYDDQRGELSFVLVAPSGAEVVLATRLVTRVWPDPASEAGIANSAGGAILPDVGVAETVAVVDVPASTPAGAYRLEIRRRRRLSPSQPSQWESLPGVEYAQSIQVLPATVNGVAGAPTPPSGFAGPLGADLTAQLAALHPHPKVVLALPGPAHPAAAHLVVAYPPAKIRLRSVFEDAHLGRGSVVAWSDDAVAGRVSVDFADPAASVGALAIAFELRDPFGAGRASASDFGVVASALFDRSGAPQGGSVTVTEIR
jgi:hypothetical protein